VLEAILFQLILAALYTGTPIRCTLAGFDLLHTIPFFNYYAPLRAFHSLAFLVVESKKGQDSYASIIHLPQSLCFVFYKNFMESGGYKNNLAEKCAIFLW
jgi:hypothetical protein